MIQVSIAAPYPGTEFYEQAVENGWLSTTDLLNSEGVQECVVQYPGLSAADIEARLDRFYGRFYLRPRVIYRIARKMIRSPHERKRRLREGKEFLSFMWQHRRRRSESPTQPRLQRAATAATTVKHE